MHARAQSHGAATGEKIAPAVFAAAVRHHSWRGVRALKGASSPLSTSGLRNAELKCPRHRSFACKAQRNKSIHGGSSPLTALQDHCLDGLQGADGPGTE